MKVVVENKVDEVHMQDAMPWPEKSMEREPRLS
jgi:hypothetical protein